MVVVKFETTEEKGDKTDKEGNKERKKRRSSLKITLTFASLLVFCSTVTVTERTSVSA